MHRIYLFAFVLFTFSAFAGGADSNARVVARQDAPAGFPVISENQTEYSGPGLSKTPRFKAPIESNPLRTCPSVFYPCNLSTECRVDGFCYASVYLNCCSYENKDGGSSCSQC